LLRVPDDTFMSFAVQLSLAPMKRLRSNPRDVIRRHRWSMIGLLVLSLIVAFSIPFARIIAINPTESLPRGLYIKSSAPIAVGSIVEFKTPGAVRANLTGHYDYLIKPIVAGPGDRVDTTTGIVIINGTPVPNSTLLATDSQGRAVQKWLDNRVLGDGEFFVLSNRIPNSVDSRYFGPINRTQIQSVRRCVWAFE
jgi:conjugative transfer signal peptidase TraF